MYVGPPIDDEEIVGHVPPEYRELLNRVNGYVAYHGGLHVRGACVEPEWHSLRAAWLGDRAIHKLFASVRPSDVPFAEDALGDQFLVRDELVFRLHGETGELEALGVDLAGFDSAARADPVEYLALQPLEQFRAEGGSLEPGQLLSVYPPFCVKESASGVSFRAISAAERLAFLASLAAQLQGVPDGAVIDFDVKP